MKDILNFIAFVTCLIFFAYIFTYIKDKINVKISSLEKEINEPITDLFLKKATTSCSNIDEVIEQRYSLLGNIQKKRLT